MQFFENLPLQDRNTFHVPASTRYWADFQSEKDLYNLLTDKRFDNLPIFTIGSGSNLLFTVDYPGLLLHSSIKGIDIIEENINSVLVRSGSGVVWDDFVAYAVKKGWSGAENLSGIPGEVGATPVQNIGAYGAEAAALITSVEAFNRKTLKMDTFSHDDCHFGYRDSVFKHEFKDRYVICYVTYRLSKIFEPNIRYKDVAAKISDMGGATLENVRQTILEIRSQKLPDPNKTGNAGSFFMNPVISSEHYQKLKEKYPEMPGWMQDDGRIKISAAWCIEKAGWKGKFLGNAGVHDRQSLVLINSGKATSGEIIALSEKIQEDVRNMFNVSLHPEVLFI